MAGLTAGRVLCPDNYGLMVMLILDGILFFLVVD